jgi:DnaJ-class molecular chaperone
MSVKPVRPCPDCNGEGEILAYLFNHHPKINAYLFSKTRCPSCMGSKIYPADKLTPMEVRAQSEEG